MGQLRRVTRRGLHDPKSRVAYTQKPNTQKPNQRFAGKFARKKEEGGGWPA